MISSPNIVDHMVYLNTGIFGKKIDYRDGKYFYNNKDYVFAVPVEGSELDNKYNNFTGWTTSVETTFDYEALTHVSICRIRIFKKGLLHASGYPAELMFSNLKLQKYYWWNEGTYLQDFENQLKENGIDIHNLTDEDKSFIKMRWDCNIV